MDLVSLMFEKNRQSEESRNTSLTEQTLRGEVMKVLFEREDGTYSVIKLMDGQGVEHTLVGMIMGSFEGQHLEVIGHWDVHKDHGRQFKVNSCKFLLPSTPEGIKRYLSSGFVKGIGPKMAERIVDRFGAETLEILDRYSAKLTEVSGFGKKRLAMVRESWRAQHDRRNIFIYLQGLGVGPGYCQRIYKTYGDGTAEVVKNNPYQLADEVDGIGFILADRLANAQGIEKTDSKRLAAGVKYALNQASLKGHVCYPQNGFLKYSAELLGVSEEYATKGLSDAVQTRKVVVDPCDQLNLIECEPMVYQSLYWTAETHLAQIIKYLTEVNQHQGQRMRGAIGGDIQFSQEQINAVAKTREASLSIITGGPGVGKTTVIGEIVRQAFRAKLKVSLAAPTGRAAKRMSESCGKDAMTIHRLLKWEPAKSAFSYDQDRPLTCDLLIVDEVSMLDVLLALFLFRAIKAGTTVVMVGDADQLPSVGPGTILRDLIQSGRCPVTHLSQIYRQGEGSRITSNAHAVNAGQMPDFRPVPKNQLSDFYWIEQEDPDKVVDTIVKMVKERIPERFDFHPMKDIQVLAPMNRGSCGVEILNAVLQKNLNPGHKPQVKFGEKVFKAGDRVMQTVNNYEKNVFNGDMGRIHRIHTEEKKFFVRFEAVTVPYEFSEIDQLKHCYAITVHKSQGSEFPVVVLPLLNQHYMMLQRNLLYTAMTRAKKLLVLIGAEKAVAMAVRNYRQEQRYSMLLPRLKS